MVTPTLRVMGERRKCTFNIIIIILTSCPHPCKLSLFREYRTKTFDDHSDDPDQIAYTQQKIFRFDENRTRAGLAETDTICTINIPLVVSAHTALTVYIPHHLHQHYIPQCNSTATFHT